MLHLKEKAKIEENHLLKQLRGMVEGLRKTPKKAQNCWF